MRARRREDTPDIRVVHDPERNASLYVTGELPHRLVRWFERHLLECEDCWQEVWLARRGRLIAEHARELPPARLRDAVRGAVQLEASSAPTSERRAWFRRRPT